MKNFIQMCLEDKQENRPTIDDLLKHTFLEKNSKNDHDLIKFSPEMLNIINKQQACSRKANKNMTTGSSMIESQDSKSINGSQCGQDLSKLKKKILKMSTNN